MFWTAYVGSRVVNSVIFDSGEKNKNVVIVMWRYQREVLLV